jgi:hypothetical protein
MASDARHQWLQAQLNTLFPHSYIIFSSSILLRLHFNLMQPLSYLAGAILVAGNMSSD